MKTILQKLLVLVCALYLGGAHWAVLQMTAWTGMLVTRASQSGLMAAVETTFDGAHPCNLCTVVEAGQKQEREQQPLPPELGKLKEAKLVAMKHCVAPVRTGACAMEWPERSFLVAVRGEAPPTPPPLA